MTYETYANKAVSAKTTIVHLEGKELVKVFSTSGNTHTRITDNFVIGVQINGTITAFTFTPTTNTLSFDFVGTIANQEVILTYRFFYSSRPVNLSFDLTDNGSVVEYEPRVLSIPGFNTQLNFAKANKTVTGSGQLSLDNSDGFFTNAIRTIHFENKPFVAYSLDVNQEESNNQIIYRGSTNNATISNNIIKFGVKDSIFNLNNQIPLPQFTASEVIERHRNRFKKSIYGRVNGMAIQSISQVGDGYDLTGTISGILGSNIITGIDTSFLSELAPRDVITASGISFTVRKVVSNNSLLIAEALTGAISGSATVLPVKPWFNTNRSFSVANHLLKAFSTTITGIVDPRRIRVSSIEDLEPGDTVLINNVERVIQTLSQVYTNSPTNTTTEPVIVLSTTLSPIPTVGQTVSLVPVSNVRNEGLLFQSNDITQSTSATETIISLSDTSEQDIAVEGYYGAEITGVLNTNYYVLGVPNRRTYTFAPQSTDDWRGSALRLAKNKDTDGPTDRFVWLGNAETVRTFTTAVAATVQFEAGDLYRLSDANMDYIGVRTNGINQNHFNLGRDEPFRVTVFAGQSFASVSDTLQTTIDSSNTEQLFSFTSTQWILLSNIGTIGANNLTNTIILPTATPPTLSNSVVVTGTPSNIDISLSERVDSRDLIRNTLISTDSQVIQAENSFVQVVTPLEQTQTAFGIFKNPDYITDTSPVTCSAVGQTFDNTSTGSLVRTPSDVVRKALIDNNLTSLIDTSSFDSATTNENVQVGIYVPYSLSKSPPTYLNLIDKCTLSGLGALGLDNNFLLKYQLLNGFKPTSLDLIRTIRNDDLRVEATQTLSPSPLFRYNISTIEASYDFGEEEPNSKLLSINDPSIGRLTDLQTTETIDLYLPVLSETRGIADRYLNYSQNFSKVVSLQGGLSFYDINVGDLVLLDLNELRFNNTNLPFIGMVTAFTRNGEQISIVVNDFGGLFVRGANISSDTLSNFTAATNTDKLLNSFLTSDSGLIGTDETTINQNLLI